MSKLLVNIFSIIIIVAAVYFGFVYFQGGQEEEETGSSAVGIKVKEAFLGGATTTPYDPNNPADQFRYLLDSVKDVDFSATGSAKVLELAIFNEGLEDFSRPLNRIMTGRANPFAPVEGDVSRYILPPEDKKTKPKVDFTTASTSERLSTTSPFDLFGEEE